MPGPTVGRAEVDVHADLSPFRREMAAAAALAGDTYGDTLGQRIDRSVRRTTRSLDRLWGSSLRGSRNDFLNFFGAVSEGIERVLGRALGAGLGRLGSSIEVLGDSFLYVGGRASDFAQGLVDVGASIQRFGTGGLDGLIIQIASLAAGLTAVRFLAGGVAAAISGLAAATTALAVGIGGALLGGLTALIPVLGAAIVGFVGVSSAITTLANDSEELFDPLDRVLQELSDAAASGMADRLGGQIRDLADILSGMAPVLEDLGGVFSSWVDDQIAIFGPSGPLQGAFQSIADSIGGLFEGVLDLVSNFSAALVGLFGAAAPAAQRLLDAINGVVVTFAAWVNSAEGSQAVNEFLDTALDLLGQIWDIAGNVGDIFRELFDAGSDSAGDLLQSLQDVTDEMAEWLGDDANRDALITWFEDGVAIARDFGDVLRGVLDVFDQLDNAASRSGLQDFLDFLEQALFLTETLIGISQAQEEASRGAWDSMVAGVESFFQWISQASVAFGQFASDFGTQANDMRVAFLEWVGGLDESWNTFVENLGLGFALIGQQFSTAVQGIGEQWSLMVQGLQLAFQVFVEWFTVNASLLWQTFVAGLQGAVTAATGLWQVLQIGFQTVAQAILITAQGLWQGIQIGVSGIARVWTRVWTAAQQLFFTVTGAIRATADATWNAIRVGLDALRGLWAAIWNGAVGLFRGDMAAVRSAASQAFESVRAGLQAVQAVWNSVWSGARSVFFAAMNGIRSVAASVWAALRAGFSSVAATIGGIARTIQGAWVSAMASVAGAISGVVGAAASAAGAISGFFNNIISVVNALIAAISRISFPSPPSWLGSLPGFASGGIVNGPTRALVGEAGPEAIIPLNRPLSQVDPSVRGISALLQGRGGMSGTTAAGTVIEPGAVTIVTPYSNPALVANEVLDRLTLQTT